LLIRGIVPQAYDGHKPRVRRGPRTFGSRLDGARLTSTRTFQWTYPMKLDDLLPDAIERNVREALVEDIGDGDITAQLIASTTRGSATVITRENAVFCGRAWATEA